MEEGKAEFRILMHDALEVHTLISALGVMKKFDLCEAFVEGGGAQGEAEKLVWSLADRITIDSWKRWLYAEHEDRNFDGWLAMFLDKLMTGTTSLCKLRQATATAYPDTPTGDMRRVETRGLDEALSPHARSTIGPAPSPVHQAGGGQPNPPRPLQQQQPPPPRAPPQETPAKIAAVAELPSPPVASLSAADAAGVAAHHAEHVCFKARRLLEDLFGAEKSPRVSTRESDEAAGRLSEALGTSTQHRRRAGNDAYDDYHHHVPTNTTKALRGVEPDLEAYIQASLPEFDEMDSNKDGVVDREEYATWAHQTTTASLLGGHAVGGGNGLAYE